MDKTYSSHELTDLSLTYIYRRHQPLEYLLLFFSLISLRYYHTTNGKRK